VSGIDWSGDAGDPDRTPGRSALLIVVSAQLATDRVPDLAGAMEDVRRTRRLPDGFTFRYSSCRPSIREAWFARVPSIPVEVTALVIDKRNWNRDYMRRTTGDDRVLHGVVKVVLAMPARHVAGQRLLIDYPSRERRKVDAIARAIASACRAGGQQSFSAVRPCPDDRRDGDIVQVADMIAGALRDRDRSGTALLASFGNRVKVVEE